jgi:hypothetical protein
MHIGGGGTNASVGKTKLVGWAALLVVLFKLMLEPATGADAAFIIVFVVVDMVRSFEMADALPLDPVTYGEAIESGEK